VYLFDCASNTTTLISINCHGTGPGNRFSLNPFISADGAFVYFQSGALDLTPGLVSDAWFNVYRRDLARQSTELVSLNRELTGSATDDTGPVSVSANGDMLLLNSWAGDLVWGDNNFTVDLFVWRANEKHDPGPRLIIQREPAEIVVRWPAGLTGFELQTSSTLCPTGWTKVIPADTATEWRGVPGQGGFFRLRLK
jgi:hypothetical protein